MKSTSHEHWIEVETVGDIAVARFARSRILHEGAVEAAAEQLLGLAGESGSRKLILDFGNVESMTTAFVGKLIAVQRKADEAGGRIVLCRVGPLLREIFTIFNVNRLIPIYAEEQEALQSF